MRLVVHQKGGYDDGATGRCFTTIKTCRGAGRWGDYFAKKKHPMLWRLIKLIKR